MEPTPNNNEPIISDEELKIPSAATKNSPSKETHLIALLGILIVVLILILAGLYLWNTTLTTTREVAPVNDATRPTAEENNEPESTTAEAEVETMNTMSSSNSLEAIEADLEATSLDSLDTELTTIENELEAVE